MIMQKKRHVYKGHPRNTNNTEELIASLHAEKMSFSMFELFALVKPIPLTNCLSGFTTIEWNSPTDILEMLQMPVG